MDCLTDHYIVIERTNVLRMTDLSTAVLCCFATYYIYGIEYPAECHSMLLFFERTIFGITSTKRLQTTGAILVDSLSKL